MRAFGTMEMGLAGLLLDVLRMPTASGLRCLGRGPSDLPSRTRHQLHNLRAIAPGSTVGILASPTDDVSSYHSAHPHGLQS